MEKTWEQIFQERAPEGFWICSALHATHDCPETRLDEKRRQMKEMVGLCSSLVG